MEPKRDTKPFQELLRELPFDYGDVRLRAFEVEDAGGTVPPNPTP